MFYSTCGVPCDHLHPSRIAGNFPIKTLVARQWQTKLYTMLVWGFVYVVMHTKALIRVIKHACILHTYSIQGVRLASLAYSLIVNCLIVSIG